MTNPQTEQELVVYVKAKRVGDWHSRAEVGRPEGSGAEENRFWVFVDLEPARAPAYYVAPAGWVENDIYREHQAFLARHGGRRPQNPRSTHHGITLDRIEQWRDRWDLLGLS